jgi:hypothetical protein
LRAAAYLAEPTVRAAAEGVRAGPAPTDASIVARAEVGCDGVVEVEPAPTVGDEVRELPHADAHELVVADGAVDLRALPSQHVSDLFE